MVLFCTSTILSQENGLRTLLSPQPLPRLEGVQTGFRATNELVNCLCLLQGRNHS